MIYQNDDSLDDLTSPSHCSSADSMNVPLSVMDSYDQKEEEDSVPSMHPMLHLADSWTVHDVLLWFKKVENGLIFEKYPNINDKLLSLKIDGHSLRRIDDETLQKLGIQNLSHRMLILQHRNNL